MYLMRNLGKVSLTWLRQIDITNLDQLKEIGAAEAFLRIKATGTEPSLNLLWALQGAIEDKNWLELDQTTKERLKKLVGSN